MIRSYTWSHSQVSRTRSRALHRTLVLACCTALVLLVAGELMLVDWSHGQVLSLLALGSQHWEFAWSPDRALAGLQHHDTISGAVSNLIQLRWR